MKITQVETLQADAGWRMFSFLKITTGDGIIGWSEFNESFGSTGLSDVIKGLSPVLIGRDPRRFEQVTQHLHVLTRQSRGGLNQQAIAAIENALLDVAATCGIDPESLEEALLGDELTDAVIEDEEFAKTLGVTGVPFAVLSRDGIGDQEPPPPIALRGAAPVQHFEAAVERLFPDGFPAA